MAIEITIPRLGWSMEEGTFIEWLKRDGAVIAAGEPLYALEGEKALQEIESVDAGILHIPANSPQPGDVVPVGAVIAFLLAENEQPPALKASAPRAAVPKTEIKQCVETIPVLSEAVAAAPSVRRLARELGVDLRMLKIAGAISANDVRRAASGISESISARPRRAPQQV